jgi:hypothetical protein
MEHNLESNLSRLCYLDIESRISDFSLEDLLVLTNSKSIKVGDVAVECLCRDPVGLDMILDALECKKLSRKNGRIRAVNMLCRRGASFPKSKKGFLSVLNDRSDDVVDCALHGLVFWQDRSLLPMLRGIHKSSSERNQRREALFSKAISAIENEDPFEYSPHYSKEQAKSLWGIKT